MKEINMRYLCLSLLSFLALLPSARAEEGTPIYRANCFIDDNKKEIGEGTMAQKSIALKDGDTVTVGEYNGLSLEVWLADNTEDASARPRRQLSLTLRDTATKKAVVSSINIFSLELPDVVIMMPEQVMYRCFATEF